MTPFTVLSGPAAAIPRNNVDTDLIIRIERMSQLKRGQFAPWTFESLRYASDGQENPDFILNRIPFSAARIVLSGANFGCGSSREMAVWALEDFGIRCVIAESFGDIFYNNCLQNGLLAIKLPHDTIQALCVSCEDGAPMTVDLHRCTISVGAGLPVSFNVPEENRQALLNGLDDIDRGLALAPQIDAFQQRDRQQRPWMYQGAR